MDTTHGEACPVACFSAPVIVPTSFTSSAFLLLLAASSSLSGRKVSQFLRNVEFPVPRSPGAHW